MSRTINRRVRRRGFTLMELLVVLAILVLLMAMVAPRILGTQKKADINAAKTQIGLFRGALDRYALDLKDYPTTDQGLRSLCEEPSQDTKSYSDRGNSRVETNIDSENGNGNESSSGTKWDGPYLSSTSVPKDPWGHAYQYEYPPTHGKGDFPDIWSYGPDGEDGTDDDIVSWTDSQNDNRMDNTRDRESSRDSRPSTSSSSSSGEKAP